MLTLTPPKPFSIIGSICWSLWEGCRHWNRLSRAMRAWGAGSEAPGGGRGGKLRAESAMKPHVVITTAYYSPLLSATTHLMRDLAEGLAEGGCRVSVITNGSVWGGRAEPLSGVALKIYRARNPFVRKIGILNKLAEYILFAAYAFVRGLCLSRVDVFLVVSTPPLVGLPMALVARLKRARLVFNLQDIFPESAALAGMLPWNGFAFQCLARLEQAIYRQAKLVVAISESFRHHLARVAPGTSVEVIPNWVDTQKLTPRTLEDDPEIAVFRHGADFVVQYAGNLGFLQDLDTVLHAAELLKDAVGIRFLFIGDGNAKAGLEKQAHLRGLANCTFMPLQPLKKVPTIYNACDIGIIPLKSGVAGIALPSKTWNYWAAAKPVVGCVEGDSALAGMILGSSGGAIVPSGDGKALAEVIMAYFRCRERVQEEGRQGRAYAEAHLSREVAISAYLRALSRLLEAERTVSVLPLNPT